MRKMRLREWKWLAPNLTTGHQQGMERLGAQVLNYSTARPLGGEAPRGFPGIMQLTEGHTGYVSAQFYVLYI